MKPTNETINTSELVQAQTSEAVADKTAKAIVKMCTGLLASGKPCNRKAQTATSSGLCNVCETKATKAEAAKAKAEAANALKVLDVPSKVQRMVNGQEGENLYSALSSVAGALHTTAQNRLHTMPITAWLEYAPTGWKVTDRKIHQGKDIYQCGRTRFSSKRDRDNLVVTIPSVNALLDFAKLDVCKELEPAQVLLLCAETVGCGFSRDTTLGSTFVNVQSEVNPEMHREIARRLSEARKAKA
jgi:hypothetical protein